MKKELKDFITIQQVDGLTTKTPHARELVTIGNGIKTFLDDFPDDIIKGVVAKMGGLVEGINLGEDLGFTFTYFPEVNAHVLFYRPDDDDFDALGGEPDVKFLFSGERVSWISSEDLASLMDLTIDYMRALLSGAKDENEIREKYSSLLERSIKQRKNPFFLLTPSDKSELGSFLGAEITIDGDDKFVIKKEYFPGIIIFLDLNGDKMDVKFAGENIRKINNYAKDQLSIFLMNHVLRYVAWRHPDIDLPEIVKKAFSFSYIKEHNL
ncbi:MAG: hypothetical protein ACTSVI_01485 [Promethearchaeota archaeon]